MGILNMSSLLCEVTAPTGLWATIINWLESGIGNYAVVIIVLTLLIKVVLLPFDFFNKHLTRKNSRKQAAMKPELDKINKRYANNKQMLNQKTMELYKRENFSLYGTCIGMLLYMVLTMVIFFTLFGALREMSSFKIQQEFKTLQSTYNTAYTEAIDSYTGDETKKEENCVKIAQDAVVDKYGEIKTGFLWIKSIWRPDNWSSVVLDYKDYISQTKTKDTELTETEYNQIIEPIATNDKYDGWNGYLILAVLTGLTSFGTTWVSALIARMRAKKKGQVYVKESTQAMNFILPLIMALFTLFYTASFGIYILAGGIFTMITSPLVNILSDVIEDKSDKKKKDKKKVSYSR